MIHVEKAGKSVGSKERAIRTEQRIQIRDMKKKRGLSGKHCLQPEGGVEGTDLGGNSIPDMLKLRCPQDL